MKGIDYLNSLAKWDNKSSFGLDSIKKVLSQLHNPQNIPKSIHVGGTNGKGTTSVAIASILGSAGFSVGLNTSPHLIRINERFIINGREASDQQISDAALILMKEVNESGVHLSYHEAITATAFIMFKGLDWIVIEVGLGGRLDASNVLGSPEVVIITSISMDHELILGDSISKIAREKAGIIKDIHNVVIGELPEDAILEIQAVASSNSKTLVYQFGHNFNYQRENQGIQFYSPIKTIRLKDYNYKGHTKTINDCMAIEASLLIGLEERYIQQGICGYYWPGRYEVIVFRNKKFIIDAAHNPASIDALVEYIKLHYPNKNDFNIIFAALHTKDWKYFVDQLKGYVRNWQIVLADSTVGVHP
ncbi:MAG: Mur ligase family protein, partial [Candidatus Paceibacterota bacterium]